MMNKNDQLVFFSAKKSGQNIDTFVYNLHAQISIKQKIEKFVAENQK
jgi:hypothetical protein